MSAPEADELQITDNRERSRWEVRQAGEVVAFAAYRLSPGRIVFTHTEVDPRHEGRGIGSQLARTVLDAAIAAGLRVTPYCPFIRAYVRRHEQYAEHVDMPARPQAAS